MDAPAPLPTSRAWNGLREYMNAHGYHTDFEPPPGMPEFAPLRVAQRD
jgi:hypothetical protein